MYNEKLLRTALKNEVYSGSWETLKVICKTLHEEGLVSTPAPSWSTAACFEESDPDTVLVIKVLEKLGYDIEGPRTLERC